jgi:E3 ubiquitin-protein ligase MARCH6
MPRPKSFPASLMAHPLWLSLSADIFTGQMIASLIVLTFVAVFLLREWISQNARPGVFEEEALPDEPPAIEPPRNPPPVPQAPVQQHQVATQPQPQAPIPLPQHQLDTTQPVNASQNQQAGPIDIDLDRWFTPQTPPTQHRSQKKKSRARHSDTDDDRDSSHRPRMLDSDDDASPQQRELFKRKMFHRRIHVARTIAARRRGFAHLQESSTPLTVPEQKAKFKFTFKAPSAPLTPYESYYVPEFSVPSGPSDANNDSPSSPFPSVALHPPAADIPFSLRRWQQTTSNESESSTSQSYPPRPALPTATRSLPSSGSNSPFLFSPGRTPTDSPSLATYRPPEELQTEAGPSNPSGYLNQRMEYFNDEVDQEFEAVGKESEEEYTYRSLGPEHGRYFRDPDDTGSDEEEVEVPDRLAVQEFLDIDFKEDIEEGEHVDDQARRHDGPADDEEEEEEDDDGLFHEGEDEDEEPDAGEELFDQWDENEAVAEAIRPQAADAAAGALARAGNQVGEAAPAAAPVADNEEGNVEDDMEGAMEGWSYSCGLL